MRRRIHWLPTRAFVGSTTAKILSIHPIGYIVGRAIQGTGSDRSAGNTNKTETSRVPSHSTRDAGADAETLMRMVRKRVARRRRKYDALDVSAERFFSTGKRNSQSRSRGERCRVREKGRGEGARTNESDGRGRVEEKIAREDLRITVDSRRSARTAQCAMGNTAHRLLTFHALFFLAANRRGRDRSGP